jgi:hypothetical protein
MAYGLAPMDREGLGQGSDSLFLSTLLNFSRAWHDLVSWAFRFKAAELLRTVPEILEFSPLFLPPPTPKTPVSILATSALSRAEVGQTGRVSGAMSRGIRPGLSVVQVWTEEGIRVSTN